MDNVTRLPFDWTKKTVLVTGGTGSFGSVFVKAMLEREHAAKVIVFSRDELKQCEMRSELRRPARSALLHRRRPRPRPAPARAMHGVDIVVHAAAMKQVPACEYNPFEAVQTNVLGAQNVIDAAIDAASSA